MSLRQTFGQTAYIGKQRQASWQSKMQGGPLEATYNSLNDFQFSKSVLIAATRREIKQQRAKKSPMVPPKTTDREVDSLIGRTILRKKFDKELPSLRRIPSNPITKVDIRYHSNAHMRLPSFNCKSTNKPHGQQNEQHELFSPKKFISDEIYPSITIKPRTFRVGKNKATRKTMTEGADEATTNFQFTGWALKDEIDPFMLL